MMEFKQIIDSFRARHAKAEAILDFGLLPLLMNELIAAGLDISKADGKFYQSLAKEIYPTQNDEFHVDMIDDLLFLGQLIPLPKETPAPVPVPQAAQAIVEDDIVRTDHLVDNIPHEDSEGDPYYTPPEERINLRPEDLAPMEYDEEFCALLGIKRPGT